MKTFIQVLTLTFITLSISACGKSSEVKAQDKAKNLTAEQNALATDLNSSGTPRSSWSEAELNAYESKLNRLEVVEAELAAANGNNGVTIFNGNNGNFIRQARYKLAEARSDKAGAKQANETQEKPA